MATPPEQPWSNVEKNYLLAEIIKAANPPSTVLFSVIQHLQLQPQWNDTPLPPGRSLNSCRNAFDDLRRSLSGPMGAPLPPLTPTPLSAPIPSLKRSFPYETSYSAGASGREIRPKPAMSSVVHAQASPSDPPAKKKRGRPTKAEALAKAEAAAASLATYGEPGSVSMLRPPTQVAPQAPQPMSAPMIPAAVRLEDTTSAPVSPLPPTTRMPIAAMLTPSAREPKSASQSHSGSSSGRRRRARSTKSEPDESPGQRGAGIRSDYESPYSRLDVPDTPARAAVLRHREDASSASRTATTPGPAPEATDRRPSPESKSRA